MPGNMSDMFGGFGSFAETAEATAEPTAEPTAAPTEELAVEPTAEASGGPEAAEEQPRRGGTEFSFPGGTGGDYAAQTGNSSLWLMVSCVAVLIVGIAVAALFKGRN